MNPLRLFVMLLCLSLALPAAALSIPMHLASVAHSGDATADAHPDSHMAVPIDACIALCGFALEYAVPMNTGAIISRASLLVESAREVPFSPIRPKVPVPPPKRTDHILITELLSP